VFDARAAKPRNRLSMNWEKMGEAHFFTIHTQSSERRRREQALVMGIKYILGKNPA